MPSRAMQATLWSERAADWADVMEGWNGWGVPVYRHVLEHVPVGTATALLDVGCGAGRFARMAADRGANVSGLDATEALLAFARERVRSGDFREGDLESLPWPDSCFDVVTGFNSFFIAADLAEALAEARRVLRPGGWLAMSVFGAPERCDSTTLFAAVMALLDRGGPGGGGHALHAEGVLEQVVRDAGFSGSEGHFFAFEERHPDVATLVRGMMAAPPMIRAGRTAGDDAVRRALTEAAAAFARDGGEVVLSEELRVVTARAGQPANGQ
jgi:SAM-dependent methyltransferase